MITSTRELELRREVRDYLKARWAEKAGLSREQFNAVMLAMVARIQRSLMQRKLRNE